jgi:hypothetical protein
VPDTALIIVGVVLIVSGVVALAVVGLWWFGRAPTPTPLPAAPPPRPAAAPKVPPPMPMPYGRWVWVASPAPGRSVLAHHPQHTGYTACGWPIDGFGQVVLSGAAVEDYQVSPCMRCYPGVPVMPGRLL